MSATSEDAARPGGLGASPGRTAPAEPPTDAARKLATEHGVELEGMTGSGRGGRVTEADVRKLLSTRPTDGAAGGDEEAASPDAAGAAELGVEATTTGEPVVPDGFNLCPACHGAGCVPDDVKEDPTVERCTDCNGLGVVLTGSLNPEHAAKQCLSCTGTGYRTRQGSPAPYERVAAPDTGGNGERQPWELEQPAPTPPGMVMVPVDSLPPGHEYHP